MSCVFRRGEKERISHSPVGLEKDVSYGWSVGARGTCLVLLEARLNVRAAMEAADLTNLA